MSDNPTDKELTIETLAAQLKKAYHLAVSAREGKPYKPSKRFDTADVWTRTAEVVYKIHANPNDYIAAQFAYSKSRVFANTLHGTVAQKRYKQYALQYDLKRLDNAEGQEENPVTAGQREIADRMAYTMLQLSKLINKTNVYDPEVIQFIVTDPGRFDPLAIMLMGSKVEQYVKLFKLRAKEILLESPCLINAAENLGYNLNYILHE